MFSVKILKYKFSILCMAVKENKSPLLKSNVSQPFLNEHIIEFTVVNLGIYGLCLAVNQEPPQNGFTN